MAKFLEDLLKFSTVGVFFSLLDEVVFQIFHPSDLLLRVSQTEDRNHTIDNSLKKRAGIRIFFV